jgi:signal transduction histidine kinase
MMIEKTVYAETPSPAEAGSPLERTIEAVTASCIPGLFDANPLNTVVLDDGRAIVYANRRFLLLSGAKAQASVLGRRIGEALGCIHARETVEGCGSSPSCCFCGAARRMGAAYAVLDAPRPERFLQDSSDSPRAVRRPDEGQGEECSITRHGDGIDQGESSLDLRIWTQAIEIGGKGLVLLVAKDISAEKRQDVLERIFYHDIANTATGIRTILELLAVVDEEPQERYVRLLKSAADQLVEEIESQRALKAAESRELAVKFEILDGKSVLAEAFGLFAYKLEGRDIALSMAPDTEQLAVESDPALLRRVLVNMIKNAIEAALRGEVLLAGLRRETGGADGREWALFWVKNSAVMPEAAQRRVFHRSFSTKGPGRGVGTYSMRLLAEKYLKGKVGFRSREGEGTVFELRIPLA